MKRFLWITLIFGGGVGALMVAAVILLSKTEEARKVASQDLRSTVEELRAALTAWDYDRVAAVTSDITKEEFDRLHAESRDRKTARLVAGRLSAMETFPSVRFTGAKPQVVEVSCDVRDGAASARCETRFVLVDRPLVGQGGYFLERAQFNVTSDDNAPPGPVEFHAGDAVELRRLTERLFDALAKGDLADLRTLLKLPDDPSATQAFVDTIRVRVMNCGVEKLRPLIPDVGALPKGTTRLRIVIEGDSGGKPLRLAFEILPGPAPVFSEFRCDVRK
jgi:hypothetical protein